VRDLEAAHALGVERFEPATEHLADQLGLGLPMEVDRTGIRVSPRPDVAQ
jgi:hypothetical protein